MSSQREVHELPSRAEVIRVELLKKVSNKARILLPFDEDKTGFDKANLRFTQYERPTYLAVVEPGCEQDVIEAVNYARERDIPFTPRGGHHAVTSTMRHFQNGICINMRPLNQMLWDAERQQVTVGGGILTDEFVHFAHDLGMEVSTCICILSYDTNFDETPRCGIVPHDRYHWCVLRRGFGTASGQIRLSQRQHGFLQACTRRRKCGCRIKRLTCRPVLGHPWSRPQLRHRT